MNMDKLKMLMMNKLNNNPMFRDLIQKAQRGDKQSVENFARNICKERGIDFDKEFANFMSNFR
jgi:hypothetical protein